MTPYITAGQLFDLAIQAEQAAETLYRRLAHLFAQHAEVAKFWTQYAEQEVQHRLWLAQIRDRVSPVELDAPEIQATVEGLQQVARFPVEASLADIATLEDAYLLVSNLENSETNVVFEFLTDRYASDASTRAFLRSQLRDHVAELMLDFPAKFGDASVRRSFRVGP